MYGVVIVGSSVVTLGISESAGSESVGKVVSEGPSVVEGSVRVVGRGVGVSFSSTSPPLMVVGPGDRALV